MAIGDRIDKSGAASAYVRHETGNSNKAAVSTPVKGAAPSIEETVPGYSGFASGSAKTYALIGLAAFLAWRLLK